MGSMVMHCGMLLVQPWFHNSCTQALLGGDISKLMKGTGSRPIIVKAMRYGYLPRSFSAFDELREDSDDKLFFSARYNPNHVLHRLLPQPKSIEHNLRQRTHNRTLSMLLWNKILYIECCSVTSINVAFMFYSHLYIFSQTIQCISPLLYFDVACAFVICYLRYYYYYYYYCTGCGLRNATILS